MGPLRTFAEAFGIFAVSIVALYVFYTFTQKGATGIGVAHWKGVVLMYVGGLYLVLGVILIRLK